MASEGLIAVHRAIAQSCARAGVASDSVELVVVSKQRSDDDVLAVYSAGQRVFAENREQGLKQRVDAALPEDIVWRHPFPGPGLAVRCLGEVTRERLQTLRDADAIVVGELSIVGSSNSLNKPEPTRHKQEKRQEYHPQLG